MTTAPSRPVPSPLEELAAEVKAGLEHPAQKRLPTRLLYDDLGSALFDAISLLPEYGLTRADARILQRHARDIVAAVPQTHVVAELGSGSGIKTRSILGALPDGGTYFPIDISGAALARCAHELAGIPHVRVEPLEADYLEGLAVAAARRGRTPLLVLFLGSTIGNFERDDAERFLASVRAQLVPGDALVLGTDLVKPVPELIAAYDDALGVTAAFNRNLLVHLNRELDADFDPALFEHRVRWDEDARRIEMHLRARRSHSVRLGVPGIEVPLRALETIWTESSHKYTLDEPHAIAARTGFRMTAQWTDDLWPFAENLFVAR